MGLRGPVRDPNSRRGVRYDDAPASDPATSERPLPPPALVKTAEARQLFEEYVDRAIASGVTVRVTDDMAFALAVQYTLDYQKAKDAAERARIGRDLMKILDDIGATPKARLRMNIKPKAAAPSKTAQILALVANK